MLRSLNASRANIGRAIAHQSTSQSRTFVVTSIRRADLVQDIFLKAISSHKPTPVKASDAEGQVQKFKMPAAPTSPEESNIANEIKSYEDQVVEIEGSSSTGEAPVQEDWFEEPEEEDTHAKGH